MSVVQHVSRHYPCDPSAASAEAGDRIDFYMDVLHRGVAEAQREKQRLLAEDDLAGDQDGALARIGVSSLQLAGYFSLADFGDEFARIRASVRCAANALVARLQSAGQPAGRAHVTAVIEEREYWIPTLGGTADAPAASDFLAGLWTTLVVRDPRLLTFLLGGPDRLGYPVGAGEYRQLWARCWQQWHTGDTRLAQTIADAESAADASGEEYATYIAAPAIRALRHLTTGAATEFDAALTEALRQHRAYWGADERRLDTLGFVAWPLLALVCQATARGLHRTVESDYLPVGLLDHAWTLPFAEDIIRYPNATHDKDGDPLYPIRLGIDGLWELHEATDR
ncbi:immunity 49 family protein [Nocardia sp. NPDC052566]|uniref:immunity 49 family protein n=1 Tax=Nocardia sp. NPDC052566 TaxID=3364330 RepID=UPI0037C9E6A5